MSQEKSNKMSSYENSEKITLSAEEELRVTIPEGWELHLTLLDGTAEIFGMEIAFETKRYLQLECSLSSSF